MAHGVLKHKRDKKKMSQFDRDWDQQRGKAVVKQKRDRDGFRKQLKELSYELSM